jgi:5-methylcytosine-specific restriction endonuclease McrA
MPWKNTPETRAASDATYHDSEYVRNAAIVLEQAGGRYGKCSACRRRGRRLQVDHTIPVSQGGTHDLANLRALCSGPASCHARKTALEGGGYRAAQNTRPADPAPRPTTTW